MPKPDPLHLVFEIEQETKNKFRYQEMQVAAAGKSAGPVAKDKAIVEKLYVDKKLLKKWGNPETLHVTIEAP